MACRRVWGAALGTGVLLAALTACGSTVLMNTAPQSTASTATASATVVAAEKAAVKKLQAWLQNPETGTLTYNTVQVTGGGTINVMSILSGSFNPSEGQADLTGSVETLGSGSTTQGQENALEFDAAVYTSIPTAMQTGDQTGKLWKAAPVHAFWGQGAAHSGWWNALDQVKNVRADGLTTLGGVTVDMYSDFLDLADVKGIPKTLLDSEPIKNAGTTKIEVDVYTALGSGQLVRVTYKLGLPVQIDAAATARSSAGYQVDMSGFGDLATVSPAPPSATPTQPNPGVVASETGDVEMAAILPF